jgi:hypothetical protein
MAVMMVVVLLVVATAVSAAARSCADLQKAQRRAAVDAHQATVASLRLEVRSLRRTLSEKSK